MNEHFCNTNGSMDSSNYSVILIPMQENLQRFENIRAKYLILCKLILNNHQEFKVIKDGCKIISKRVSSLGIHNRLCSLL
jgi:hypothetical protein